MYAYLLVMKSEKLSPDQRATLGMVFALDPWLSTIRDFAMELQEIFQARTRQAARSRRTRLLRKFRFRQERLLQRALERIEDDCAFEKLIVSLSWHRVPRTNNHVGKANRAFRLVQKTRYKRRRHFMIKQAYWLHLIPNWQEHPLKVDRAARPQRIRRKARSQLGAAPITRAQAKQRSVRRSA